MPGVSTIYCLDAALQRDSLQDLFGAANTYIPNGFVITIENSGDVIDEATGEIRATWAGGSPLVIPMGGAGGYAGPSGAQVTWNTQAIVQGRRLRGRTNFVPLVASAYDATGTLVEGFINQMAPAVAFMYTTNPDNFRIYSRPRAATPSWTDVQGRVHPAVPARIGQAFGVVGATIRDKAVVLRSRRD